MTIKPTEEKRTPQELKVRWLKLCDTVEKVKESKRGAWQQSQILKEKIREYRVMLERIRRAEVEDSWLANLEKITDKAWEKYLASVEEEAERGK